MTDDELVISPDDFHIKFLIVDDDPDVRNSISDFVLSEFANSEVVVVNNGIEAVNFLKKETISIVITDTRMPYLDDTHLLKHIKYKFPGIDVITIIGDAKESSFADAIHAGAIDFIAKPFKKDELKAKLCRVVRERQLIHKLRKEIQDHRQTEENLRKAHVELEHRVAERTEDLQKALDDVKTLRGIIPICSYCNKIRDDKGAWAIVEAYITEHTDAEFSHGICPDCYEKQVAEFDKIN